MKKPGIVLLLAILVSLVLSTPALASPSFSDVPNGSVFYQYVTRLAEQGIVSGFPAASFHPYDFITRQQLAKMIVLATHTSIEDATSPPIFTDLSPHLGRPYPYDYVVAMFRAGFFAPMGDTARPLYEMTRTHLAIVLCAPEAATFRILRPATRAAMTTRRTSLPTPCSRPNTTASWTG